MTPTTPGRDDAADRAALAAIAPLPWTGRVEEVPIGCECDDVDLPFVIRDARGNVVLSLYERYGTDFREEHRIVGERIVAALRQPDTGAGDAEVRAKTWTIQIGDRLVSGDAETVIDQLVDHIDTIERLARLEHTGSVAVTEALKWYAEQVAGCRKITSEGDQSRRALDADGGKRARAALEAALGSRAPETGCGKPDDV